MRRYLVARTFTCEVGYMVSANNELHAKQLAEQLLASHAEPEYTQVLSPADSSKWVVCSESDVLHAEANFQKLLAGQPLTNAQTERSDANDFADFFELVEAD